MFSVARVQMYFTCSTYLVDIMESQRMCPGQPMFSSLMLCSQPTEPLLCVLRNCHHMSMVQGILGEQKGLHLGTLIIACVSSYSVPLNDIHLLQVSSTDGGGGGGVYGTEV